MASFGLLPNHVQESSNREYIDSLGSLPKCVCILAAASGKQTDQ